MNTITGFTEDKDRYLDIDSIGEAFKKRVIPYDQDVLELMELLRSYQLHLDKEKLAKARTKAAKMANNESSKEKDKGLWEKLAVEAREWDELYNDDPELNQAVRDWK